VSGRMSCIILRGRWCHIIILNVLAPTEDKTDDVWGLTQDRNKWIALVTAVVNIRVL
jgi:hypothetical protein